MANKEISMKDLKIKVDSIFVLINLAGKRIKELVSGAPKLVETESDDLVEIALEEISQGKISPGKREDIPQEEISDNVRQAEESTEKAKKQSKDKDEEKKPEKIEKQEK